MLVSSLFALISSASACILYNNFDCRNFKLVSYPTNGVEKGMIIGTSANIGSPQLAADFSGLWYMDGNPLSDEVLSFANLFQDASTGLWARKVYDSQIWTFDNNTYGQALWDLARLTELTYLLSKTNATTWHVTPTGHFPLYMGDISASLGPNLVEFDIVRTADPNVWLRPSSFFGKAVGSYTWYRIVNADGSRTKYYNSPYLSNINNPNNVTGITLTNSQLIANLAPGTSF